MIFMTRRTLVRTAALETGMMLAAPLLAAETKPLTGAELQKEAVSISKVLRCPVSPNLTLYDSESAIANELKGVIYEKLRAGETREQRHGDRCVEPVCRVDVRDMLVRLVEHGNLKVRIDAEQGAGRFHVSHASSSCAASVPVTGPSS